MANHSNSNLYSLDNGDHFFTGQNENLQHLETVLTSLAGENMSELERILPGEWRILEELEQQVWAALFPASPPHYAAEHRMTMSRIQPKEQH